MRKITVKLLSIPNKKNLKFHRFFTFGNFVEHLACGVDEIGRLRVGQPSAAAVAGGYDCTAEETAGHRRELRAAGGRLRTAGRTAEARGRRAGGVARLH